MGMFDWYQPRPHLKCPACSDALSGWQGKDGPCGLFEWTQGYVSPKAQLVDDECALTPPERTRFRLPDQFALYTSCASCERWIEAHGSCDAGVWNRTDLIRPLASPGVPDGWSLIDRDDRIRILAELRREISPGHALHGKRLLPLARRADRDDVLLQELSQDGPLWLVHLTWRPESDPRWPVARSFPSLETFADSQEHS
jgi:hypothetical protein